MAEAEWNLNAHCTIMFSVLNKKDKHSLGEWFFICMLTVKSLLPFLQPH